MHNEKAKRIRNAHRAFVEKTMEGATRILKRGYYMRPRRTVVAKTKTPEN